MCLAKDGFNSEKQGMRLSNAIYVFNYVMLFWKVDGTPFGCCLDWKIIYRMKCICELFCGLYIATSVIYTLMSLKN